jgi:hypothetical protein
MQSVSRAHARDFQPEHGLAGSRASLKTGASEFRQQHEQLAALLQRSIETGADVSLALSPRLIQRR